MKKRLLAVFLALCMALSLLPIASLAEEETTPAETEVQAETQEGAERELPGGTDAEEPDAEVPETEEPATGEPDAGKPETEEPDNENPETGEPATEDPAETDPDEPEQTEAPGETGSPEDTDLQLMSGETGGECGSGVLWSLNEDTGTLIISFDGTDGSGAVFDYTSSDKAPWYSHQIDITNVVIGNGVTRIGNYAFAGCIYVETVSLPATLTSIGSYAFSGCTSIEEIVIPAGVRAINAYTFNGCTELESITIPESVVSVGERAFYNCDSLNSVTLPDSVTSVGSYAFAACSYLEQVTLSAKLTSISDYMFSGCGNLKDPIIPPSVSTIGRSAFYNCDNLLNIVIPSSVTTINREAFADCDRLTSVTIQGGVTEIGGGDYSNSISEIGAFYSCDHLRYITLPKTLTSVKYYAFYGCYRLCDVYYTGTQKVWNSNVSIMTGNTALYNATMHFGASANSTLVTNPPNVSYRIANGTLYISGTGDMYENDLITTDTNGSAGAWLLRKNEITAVVVEPGITGIADHAFRELSYVESVTISNTVTNIGSYAFAGCTSLTTLTFPDSVQQVWDHVCDGCSDLATVRFSNQIGKIRDYSFNNCTNLDGILIPGNVKTVGQYAFYNCDGMSTLMFENGATSIGDYAFAESAGLYSVTLPTTLYSIGERAFYNCDSLNSVTLPDSVTSVGAYAFAACSCLEQITLSAKLTSISDYMFSGCGNLKDPIIPPSVSTIGRSAFYNCDNLLNIVIPSSVTTINREAFADCDRLTSVTIQGGVTEIGGGDYSNSISEIGAFYSCDHLRYITLPKTLTSVKYYAFYGCNALTDVYFDGTAQLWNGNVSVKTGNTALVSATFHFESTTSVPVTGVTLDPKTLTLEVGETGTLAAVIAPEDASYRFIVWSSSDTSVATVMGGVVTAVAPGTATITVTTSDGGFTDTCAVVVTGDPIVPVTGVSLNKTALSLTEGASETLTATVAPADATNQTVSWSSSDNTVATVENGVVTAGKVGSATITVTTLDGGQTAACVVTVTEAPPAPIPVTGVSLDKLTLSLETGGTETLTATITPADATNKNVTWTSSNEAAATVADGVVTAVAPGVAVVSVKTQDGGYNDFCVVTVTNPASAVVSVTGVSLNKTALTLEKGASETLTATVAPADATNKTVTWSTSDSTVATVANGVVTAVKAGTATITVTTEDGSKTAACAVTVTGTDIGEDDPALVVGEAKGRPESTVDVPIRLENNPGVVSMRLQVSYDRNVLSLVEVVDGGILGTTNHNPSPTTYPYLLSWENDTAAADFTADGVLVTLRFTIAEDAPEGTSAVTVSYDAEDADILNHNMEPVAFATQSGAVTVTHVIPGDIDGNGKVNAIDRMTLSRYLAKWEGYAEIDLLAADLDENGKVNSIDRMILARHLAKWEGYTELPYHS